MQKQIKDEQENWYDIWLFKAESKNEKNNSEVAGKKEFR